MSINISFHEYRILKDSINDRITKLENINDDNFYDTDIQELKSLMDKLNKEFCI